MIVIISTAGTFELRSVFIYARLAFYVRTVDHGDKHNRPDVSAAGQSFGCGNEVTVYTRICIYIYISRLYCIATSEKKRYSYRVAGKNR